MKIQTEVYSRVAGFFRPVNSWNLGKKEEYNQRKTIKLKKTGENSYKKELI
jgi:ribonucleoside-triphosphate reductase